MYMLEIETNQIDLLYFRLIYHGSHFGECVCVWHEYGSWVCSVYFVAIVCSWKCCFRLVFKNIKNKIKNRLGASKSGRFAPFVQMNCYEREKNHFNLVYHQSLGLCAQAATFTSNDVYGNHFNAPLKKRQKIRKIETRAATAAAKDWSNNEDDDFLFQSMWKVLLNFSASTNSVYIDSSTTIRSTLAPYECSPIE